MGEGERGGGGGGGSKPLVSLCDREKTTGIKESVFFSSFLPEGMRVLKDNYDKGAWGAHYNLLPGSVKLSVFNLCTKFPYERLERKRKFLRKKG